MKETVICWTGNTCTCVLKGYHSLQFPKSSLSEVILFDVVEGKIVHNAIERRAEKFPIRE